MTKADEVLSLTDLTCLRRRWQICTQKLALAEQCMCPEAGMSLGFLGNFSEPGWDMGIHAHSP